MAGGVRTSISLETTCGALLQELEKKVDEARTSRARLHQSLVAKEAELASLTASLGEQIVHHHQISSFQNSSRVLQGPFSEMKCKAPFPLR